MKNLLPLIALFAWQANALESLSIEKEKDTYLPYESIHILAHYHGKDIQDLTVANDKVQIHVKAVDTESTLTMDHFVQACFPPVPDGKERDLSNVFQISADPGKWMCEKPGRYRAWITLESGVASNPVEFRILKPRSAPDAEAAAKIANCPGFATFHHLEGGDMYVEALELATQLAEGASAYRAPMRDLLVRNYCQKSFANGKVREPNLGLALRYRDAETPAEGRKFGKLQKVWLLKRAALSEGKQPESLGIAAEEDGLLADAPQLQFSRSMKQIRGIR